MPETIKVHAKTLGAGVLGLVGLLAVAAAFVFHPAWLMPVLLLATAANLAILVAITLG
jgi:hypothetical protein